MVYNFQQGVMAGASGAGSVYVPAGAVSLDGSADYFSKTFSSAPDSNQILTLSYWIKRLRDSADGILGTPTAHYDRINHGGELGGSQVALTLNAAATTGQVGPDAAFREDRDYSAWMHVVVAIDTTQVTSTNRCKFYINGEEKTTYELLAITVNETFGFLNNTTATFIGKSHESSQYANCYLSEVIVVDGTQLDASSFGEYDANGNWIPKDPTGLTFGTNGFWLDFADSANLGNDVSGNNNDFTPNSMSAANYTSDRPADKVLDDLGNYATWNPLFINTYMDSPATNTYTNGNLTYTGGDSGGGANPISTIPMDLSVSWYVEVTYDSVNTGTQYVGIHFNPTFTSGPSGGISYEDTGNKNVLGSSSAYGATYTSGDVIGIYYDSDNDQLSFYKNGSSQGVAASSVSSNGARAFVYAFFGVSSDQVTLNAGQNAFTGTPPAGAKKLHTANLPAPTVTDPSKYFNTVLYTGNGTAIGSGGNAITGVGFQPDLVWIKNRDAVDDSHMIFDAISGATKYINTDDTTQDTGNNPAQATDTESLTTFGSDGFTVGSNVEVNTNTENYVAWCMKFGGSGSANASGSISSTVSVAAHGGAALIHHEGTGANGTVGHGMSSTPALMIHKNLDTLNNQIITYCDELSTPATDYLLLNRTVAKQTGGTSFWNSTVPTTSVFSVGSNPSTNNSSDTILTLAFARVPGLIGIGKYTGNGSTDGPYIIIDDGGSGFRPAWLMIKRIDTANSWTILDCTRSTYNPTDLVLLADSTQAESGAGSAYMDFTANGFKNRATSLWQNASGGTYIYLAFAEYPFGGDTVAQAKAR